MDEADTDVFSDVIAGLQDEARREREGVWSVLRFYSLQAFSPPELYSTCAWGVFSSHVEDIKQRLPAGRVRAGRFPGS